MAAKRDYYEVLGLSKGASQEEIKKAYKYRPFYALWHTYNYIVCRYAGAFKKLDRRREIIMSQKVYMYKFSPMNESNLNEMARIQIDAYPGFAQGTTLEQYAERIAETNSRSNVKYHCAYNNDKLVGGFNVWDFEMNMRQSMIKAGGIGSVAVDLCHKKEKVCREIVSYFLNTLRDNGANIALLYPFNSAFYHRMGFGFGTLLQQFRIKPSDLPGGNSKSHIVRLLECSAEKLAEFYNSRAIITHGLITKRADEFATRLKAMANKIFAYVAPSGEICGYVVCQFKKGSEESSLVNDMVISELMFNSPEVFMELMAFIKSQSDQVRYVIINTQDEGFINTLADPRNHMERMLFPVYQECCRTGLGIMYRICNVEAFFADIQSSRFGNLSLTLKVNVNDSFIMENNRAFVLEFCDGQCKVGASASADVELNIDIAEFSSLVMGCTNLKHLVRYGKAVLSNTAYLGVLSRSFSLDEKPVCLTYF